jgi:hypothetical protein
MAEGVVENSEGRLIMTLFVGFQWPFELNDLLSSALSALSIAVHQKATVSGKNRTEFERTHRIRLKW